MAMNGGNSAINQAKPSKNSGYYQTGNGGGNSGCVISPAPGLGLSAYQDPNVPARKPLPKYQGV